MARSEEGCLCQPLWELWGRSAPANSVRDRGHAWSGLDVALWRRGFKPPQFTKCKLTGGPRPLSAWPTSQCCCAEEVGEGKACRFSRVSWRKGSATDYKTASFGTKGFFQPMHAQDTIAIPAVQTISPWVNGQIPHSFCTPPNSFIGGSGLNTFPSQGF